MIEPVSAHDFAITRNFTQNDTPKYVGIIKGCIVVYIMSTFSWFCK